MVLPVCTASAPRYTARPEWSSPGESMWMRLSKFSLYNRLSVHSLARLIAVRPDEALADGVDLRRADRFVIDKLADVLETSDGSARAGFCCATARPALGWASTELRYCPTCLEQGFHAAWFQWRFIERCPVHRRRLRHGCRQCAAVIPYVLARDMAAHPLSCARCNTCWVPGLNRPAGRCTPITGQAARVLRRWKSFIADTVIPLTAPASRCRDPNTGRFIVQPAPWLDGRKANLAEYMRLLNRLYDVPPPSSFEVLRRQPAFSAAGSTRRFMVADDDDWQTDAAPQYSQIDWPHFGIGFREYEHTVDRVGRELFGNMLCPAHASTLWARPAHQCVLSSRDVGSDSATALGWSLSWYGLTRACVPKDRLSTPALGLAGWLAHLPHRPADVPQCAWRDQLNDWLYEDLMRSAWIWSRIASFMRDRGHYLLIAWLARPCELATLRRNDNTPSTEASAIPKS
ncbi:hypothetical protein BurMR1_1827 [Burkholderia sp. MR1]|nr:hypothetical protein BurMR1_1827 [Burkholderia sp. MR1]